MDVTIFKTLGVAGIGAAVFGAWSTIKNVLTQLSAVVVVQAQLNGILEYHVTRYLKTEWKRIPSGIFRYKGIWITHSDGENKLTPFLVLNKTTVFYKKWHFLFYKIGDEPTIYSIRGFCNFEKLIEDVINTNTRKDQAERNNSSNYIVLEKRGTAGDFMRMSNSVNPHSNGSTLESTSNSNNRIDDALVDASVEKSFMYKLSDYNYNTKSDPFEGMVYSDEIYKYIAEAERWLKSKQWYLDRNIPHRRAWAIHGPGGTGKSRLACVVGKVLNVPVYSIILSTMTNNEFIETWENMSFPCVVLFDDFDGVFNKRENITSHKSLTFDCLLNTISGVKSIDGVFLMLNTNKIETLDEALGVSINDKGLSSRPGRIDRVIYMGPAGSPERYKLIKRILCDWPYMWDNVLEETNGHTVAQVIETCREKAFAKMEELENPPQITTNSTWKALDELVVLADYAAARKSQPH